jgi:putative holliday junction resolvase
MIVEGLAEFYKLLKPYHPIISIDYGEKKCGIAISNQELTVAMPLLVISKTKESEKISAILETIDKYSASGIVIGLPVNMDGSLGSQSENLLKFARLLAKQTELPLYMQDERLTTKTANSMLRSIGIKRKARNEADDALSASLILETVLASKTTLF